MPSSLVCVSLLALVSLGGWYLSLPRVVLLCDPLYDETVWAQSKHDVIIPLAREDWAYRKQVLGTLPEGRQELEDLLADTKADILVVSPFIASLIGRQQPAVDPSVTLVALDSDGKGFRFPFSARLVPDWTGGYEEAGEYGSLVSSTEVPGSVPGLFDGGWERLDENPSPVAAVAEAAAWNGETKVVWKARCLSLYQDASLIVRAEEMNSVSRLQGVVVPDYTMLAALPALEGWKGTTLTLEVPTFLRRKPRMRGSWLARALRSLWRRVL